ncbi:MAG: hypothetical protein V7605_2301 [Acidimicrobiaceae bacterium]|jgi:uncharacterized protein (DUF983 family)
MIGRGLTKRCPLCGSGGLYTGWFRMRDRCPGCGYRFEREEGFFLGAYVINLGVTEGLVLLGGIVPCIILLATDPEASVIPVLIVSLVLAVIAPMVFYPFSRTLWSAIDLIIRPQGAKEPRDRT